MSNSWFRFYNEVLNDPKVQNLEEWIFKIWINCLCVASLYDGRLGTLHDVSFALRETKERVSLAFHTLIEFRFIVTIDETFHMRSWNKRQYISDSSTERVRKYRKRFKNVTVTPPDSDSDSDSEVDTKEVSTKRTRKKNSYPEEFESFWKIYPVNAASKSEALKSYNRAISKGTAHEQIERAAGAYAAYLDRSGIDAAHATTWLNQQRWAIDYAALGGRKTNGEPAKQSFRSEAERIAAGFLSQPRGQGEIDTGIGPSLRIAEAIRENGE